MKDLERKMCIPLLSVKAQCFGASSSSGDLRSDGVWVGARGGGWKEYVFRFSDGKKTKPENKSGTNALKGRLRRLGRSKDLSLQSEKLHAKTGLVIDHLSRMQTRKNKADKTVQGT